ncbi:hypothetical protein CDL15_Pgr028197 [Punica granatum]|uniref:Uncharacterized protein n=1 Tax=Punica granatum TaxID=22663 RepID=A0A218XG51_PUNGR|nr:hypothetical protein CDL15_Pgr028197 [Punica granatum]
MWVRSLSEIQPRARSPEGSADGKEKMKGTLIVMGRRRGREEGGKKQEGRRLVEDSSLNSRQIRSRQLMWVRSSKLLVVELKVDRRQATNMCEVVIEDWRLILDYLPSQARSLNPSGGFDDLARGAGPREGRLPGAGQVPPS